MKKIAFILSIFLPMLSVLAQTTIVISDPQRKFPIALPQLCVEGSANNANTDIPNTISKDLDLSGYFEVLAPASYIESAGKCGATNYGDWSVVKAEWLAKGTVSGAGASLRVQMYLHDVPNQKTVLGKEYQGGIADIPLIAHKFANEIMKYITGESGPFGSRIVFSSRVGRFKDLFIMGMDGSNIRQLTNDRGLSLSPAWDPAGQNVLYTSYRNRIPDLFTMDVDTGRSRQLTKNSALEVGGAFTKDGRAILTSVSEDRGSYLKMLGLDGDVLRNVTSATGAIDVSPSFSPDGSQVAFCSNRGGGPQIYVMGSDGSNPRRISFVNANYCTSPSWSPKGDRIAYVCRSEGGFNVYLSNTDGSNPIQLTSGGSNEDPDWSPDGRYLVFASTFGKRAGFNLAIMRVAKNLEGSSMNQISFSRGDDTEPTWGPVP